MAKQPKKITYVLTVSRYFPASHPRAGEPTNFIELINSGDKRHTVRGNYKLWAARAEKINAGKAVLSIRYWSGKPYSSKQVEFAELSSIGLQKVHVYQVATTINNPALIFRSESYSHLKIFIDKKIVPVQHPFMFAAHDGLSINDLKAWFKKPVEDGALIHFSNFRY